MFDFPPFRPPSEANSALIRVTRGCPWNHCTFCAMYKKTRFSIRHFSEIAEDVKKLKQVFPFSRNVFIGDSDSLLHKEILRIINLIRHTYPLPARLTSYARSHTLALKGEDKLDQIKNAGLTRVHVGLESGCAEIVKKIKKGIDIRKSNQGGAWLQKKPDLNYVTMYSVVLGEITIGRGMLLTLRHY